MFPWMKSDSDVGFSIKEFRGSIGREGERNQGMHPSLYVYQPVLKLISKPTHEPTSSVMGKCEIYCACNL